MPLGTEHKQLNLILIITRSEKQQGGETVELKREKFEAPSITAAKSKATKIANKLVFLKNKIKWDDTNGNIVGSELRWRNWDTREPYEQEDGKRIGWSGKLSEHFYGNWDPETDTSPTYYAWVTLYWEIAR